MAGFERIKYDGSPDIIVWRYPKDDITLGSQLIVNESQEALFFKEGATFDLFGPGTHTISSENLPFLKKIVNLPFSGNTPFTAEIYYINKVAKLDYKWGTKTPIQIEDLKYKVLLSFGAFGQFGLRVNDSRTFVTQIVGTLKTWDANSITEYFRGVILNRVKDQIAKYLVSKNISIANINASIEELSQISEENLRVEFNKYGLELLKFFITSIAIPEEELAKIQKGAFQNLEIEQMGDARYKVKRGFDVMETAASNEGAPGTLMGGGIGLGLGVQMAGAFTNIAQGVGVQSNITPKTNQPAAEQSGIVCPNCKKILTIDSIFCSQCGTKMEVTCPTCANKLSADSIFCNKCGKNIK